MAFKILIFISSIESKETAHSAIIVGYVRLDLWIRCTLIFCWTFEEDSISISNYYYKNNSKLVGSYEFEILFWSDSNTKRRWIFNELFEVFNKLDRKYGNKTKWIICYNTCIEMKKKKKTLKKNNLDWN